MPHDRLKCDLIDREALDARLNALFEAGEPPQRRQVAAELKAVYDAAWQALRDRHQQVNTSGLRTAWVLSQVTDHIIASLFTVVTTRVFPLGNPTEAERLAVVATGGYGRGELAPFSDIDLLFLMPYKRTSWAENVTEYILYVLWDLNLKVGHAVRTPQDCIRTALDDLTIATGLLESRAICGEESLFKTMRSAFDAKVVKGRGASFVEDKLAERDARHHRMGDSRYVVEPNLKDGKGGLRDMQTLFWIGRFLYGTDPNRTMVDEGFLTADEYRTFRKAEEFLWTVRVALHYLTGRAEERLTFDVQLELAQLLRYADRPGQRGVERFMKHYFLVAKQVGDLTRTFCAVLEARHQKKPLFGLKRLTRRTIKGFKLDADRLTLRSEQELQREPRRMVRIFAVAHETGLDVHPDALRLIARNLGLINPALRRNEQANADFMSVLTSSDHPEVNLRRMNEAGVFGRFVPDFGRVVAQMQYDMYHHYTVDEHTINAIGLLAAIERGEMEEMHPLAHHLIHKLVSRRVLYVAVLLHDIAKGRDEDHSIAGERVAQRLCPRLGMSKGETDQVAWLVRYHLLMSHFAFKRDINDRKTIQSFCEQVKSPERLRLLLILTVVDIRAVGPGVWNGWKGQLLRDLYHAAEEVLVAGHVSQGREKRLADRRQALDQRLADWPAALRRAMIDRFHSPHLLSEDIDTLEANARLIRQTEEAGEQVGIAVQVKPFEASTTVTVLTRDARGVFRRMAGAFAAAGAMVVDAKIHTTVDGFALDNFAVQASDRTALSDDAKLKEMDHLIRQALAGRINARELIQNRRTMRRRTEVFKVEPLVLIDNNLSNRATVIEVNARDRAGLLLDLAETLFDLRLSIVSAHIATYGERAVDTFYVQSITGEKVERPARLRTIETRLYVAASGPLRPKATRPRVRAGNEATG